jgi:hypothetical protein
VACGRIGFNPATARSANRSVEGDRLTSKHRWGLWQKPARDEQQSRKRASNEDEIAGYGHRLSLLKIEQFQFAFRIHPKSRTHHWTPICSIGEDAAVMETGFTLVTNVTKHSTPMANVAKLNTLVISAPCRLYFAPTR